MIELGVPAPPVPEESNLSAAVWYLASAKTTPFSVVWSALSTNSQAAPVVVTATPEVEFDIVADVLYL